MKRLKYLIIIVLSLMIFNSCKKQIGNVKENVSNMNTNYENLLPKIIVENGMLSFKNEKDFLTIYNYFDKIINDENFDEQILNFKAKYNYSSLIDKFNKEEQQWLNYKTLDLDNDPDDNYIDDDVYRLLLNENGEIIVDDVIYKFANNNVVYRVNNKNFVSLQKINNNPDNYSENAKIKDIVLLNWDPDKSSSDCKQNFSVKGYNNYKKDYEVKYKASVINLPFTACIKAETFSLHLENGKWKKYKTNVKAKVYTSRYYRNSQNGRVNCPNQVYYDLSPEKYAGKTDDYVIARRGLWEPFRIHKDEVKTYFYCNGWSKNLTLTW